MDIVQFWKLLRSYWWLPLGVMLLAGVGAELKARSAPPLYQTSTHLVVTQAQSPGPQSYDDILASEQLAATYSALLQSPPFLQEAITQLHLPLTPASLASKVSTQVIFNTPLIQLTIQDTDRRRAATIANGLADVLRSYAQGLQARAAQDAAARITRQLAALQQAMALLKVQMLPSAAQTGAATAEQDQLLQNEYTQDQNRYDALLNTQQQMIMAQSQADATVTVVGRALVPTAPITSGNTRNLLLALVLGFLAGLGLALLIDRLNDRPRSKGDLQGVFNVAPLDLAYVRGRASRLLIGTTVPSGSQFAHSLLLLRATIERMRNGEHVALCITSAHPREGASTVAANLALLEAQAGRRVVLIDANLRNPQLHLFFDVPNHRGLSDFLPLWDAGADLPLQQKSPGLAILTAGPALPDPAGLLGTPQVTDLIKFLRQEADMVIIDTPSLGLAPDALLLQQVVNGTVLVLDARRVRHGIIRDALASLEDASGALWGVVLNKTGRKLGITLRGGVRAFRRDPRFAERADAGTGAATHPLSPLGR